MWQVGQGQLGFSGSLRMGYRVTSHFLWSQILGFPSPARGPHHPVSSTTEHPSNTTAMGSDVRELGRYQLCTHKGVHTPPADRLRGAQLDERRRNVPWVSITPQLVQGWPLSACAGLCH